MTIPTGKALKGIHLEKKVKKYLYTHADPINNIDPSGMTTIIGQTLGQRILGILNKYAGPVILRSVQVATAVCAVAVTTEAISSVNTKGPCGLNQMVFQLQQGTIETESVVKKAPPLLGVTVGQAGLGLRELYYKRFNQGWWPSELDSWLFTSIVQLSRAMTGLPAVGGVLEVGTILTRQTGYRNKNYRVDVENRRGHNLRH